MVDRANGRKAVTDARRDLLSIVTPTFNEERNIPVLYERLKQSLDPLDQDWEWIVVDDHSADASFAVASGIAAEDPRVRCYRLSRNSGSHAACTCGIHACDGDAAVIMASDLQDPPELIPSMVQAWLGGAQVVSAVRRRREGEKGSTIFLANLFYWIMRNVLGMAWMPATGADFMLIDRRVVAAFRRHQERNVHLFALITWMGFRQQDIFYDKQARLHGRSGWNLARRIKLAIDTVTPFSYLPIRFMSLTGVTVACGGFLYALFIIAKTLLTGREAQGWASLMVAILVIGGLIMVMLGILGEYVWRAYEEARRRPAFIVESEVDRRSARSEDPRCKD
ncbi:MAG: glycosyltransferase family 2 protein [Alphaproteobacteria bacterium]|nr:glycosyltransferase family 2 protein [Alphaproteobacteria bacterium]